MGSASTWSLERISALAEEAARAFYHNLQELGVVTPDFASAAKCLPDSTLLTLHLDLVRGYPTQLITVRGGRSRRCAAGPVAAPWGAPAGTPAAGRTAARSMHWCQVGARRGACRAAPRWAVQPADSLQHQPAIIPIYCRRSTMCCMSGMGTGGSGALATRLSAHAAPAAASLLLSSCMQPQSNAEPLW